VLFQAKAQNLRRRSLQENAAIALRVSGPNLPVGCSMMAGADCLQRLCQPKIYANSAGTIRDAVSSVVVAD
jgi:hypothetical protein